jgi:hypothetical protein
MLGLGHDYSLFLQAMIIRLDHGVHTARRRRPDPQGA